MFIDYSHLESFKSCGDMIRYPKVASSRPVYHVFNFQPFWGYILLTKTCYYPRCATIAMSSNNGGKYFVFMNKD